MTGLQDSFVCHGCRTKSFFFGQHRALDEVNDESKKEERTSPNVSLVDAIDISHQKETEEEKIKVAKKPPKDAVAAEDDAGAKLKRKLAPAKVSKRKKWKKPKDKPKRPLSAYNLFFQSERERLLHGDDEPPLEHVATAGGSEGKSDGRIGFAALAKEVASKWKGLSPEQKIPFEERAKIEKERYKGELEEWKKNQVRREQEAEEWAARREDVIRSLSTMASEQERTERALQAAVSMQPEASSLSQRYGYNDSLANQLQSRQLNQYDQMLLNDQYSRQRLQQERAFSLPTMSASTTENAMRRLQEASPMDFYTRMIYSGTSDPSAADAMHSYLSAQFAAAGRSLGMSSDMMSSMGASAGESHLGSQGAGGRSLSLPHASNMPDVGSPLPLGLGSQYGYGGADSAMPQQQQQQPRDVLQEMSQMSPQDMSYLYGDDDYYNLMPNQRRGPADGRRPH